jgi:Inner membrane component of T3SS, cytoplasmic domain/Domain of unknown function (DUF1707)
VARASDDTREQAVGALRQGLLTGRLGTETFIERVDAAYRAKTHHELDVVTEDLPHHRRAWRALLERLSPAPARLAPPEMQAGESRVLGRDAGCDYVVADPTVSMRHAELVRRADGWAIRDLDSRNGTRVNGWLAKEQRLRAGDTLTMGRTTFVFQPDAQK